MSPTRADTTLEDAMAIQASKDAENLTKLKEFRALKAKRDAAVV